jgi:hypothetical protein
MGVFPSLGGYFLDIWPQSSRQDRTLPGKPQHGIPTLGSIVDGNLWVPNNSRCIIPNGQEAEEEFSLA